MSRTALILAATMMLVTLGVASSANAAPSPKGNAPAASADAGTPIDDTVTIHYAINRGAQAIASQACDVDGIAVDCDTAADSTTKKASTWSIDMTGLADGDHTFSVAFILTGGGSAAASADFTIDVSSMLEADCASLGGVLTGPEGTLIAWRCTADPYNAPVSEQTAVVDAGKALLQPYCSTDVGAGTWISAGVITHVEWFCRTS